MTITSRIDKVTSIPYKYRHQFIPPPISVKIELTAKCNYRCGFCARSQNLRDAGHMDFDTYKRLVNEMLGCGVQEIGMFYLGESFLYPHLVDAIEYAKHKGCEYVFLTTNGSVADAGKVEKCMMAGLDSLKFSFNYADKEQFESIAQVKGAYFDRMIQNIKNAWIVRDANSFDCGLYASYIEYDGEQGEKMKEALRRIEGFVDEVYALPLYSQAGILTDIEKGKGWKPVAGNTGRVGALRPGIPCWSMFTEAHVTYDAKLTGCCFGWKPDFDFGDLNQMSFLEAWNSERAQWFRRHHLKNTIEETPCKNCLAY